MKSIPIDLLAHQQEDATTLALLCKVSCKDGTQLAFTSLDADIAYDDGDDVLTYLASNGFTPKRFEASADQAVDNSEFEGWIQDTGITEAQIRAGLFDFARIAVYRVNYLDTSMGHEFVMGGTCGETVFSQNGWRTEFRSKTQQLKQPISYPYSVTCVAKFGSTTGRWPCHKAMTWVAGSVTSVGAETDRIFTDSALTQPDDHFVLGVVEFLTGDNTGFEAEVEIHASDALTLVFPTPYPIAIGDTYRVRQDCSKEWEYCKDVHNNLEWFRGQQFIPVDGSPQVPSTEIRRSGGSGGGK